MGDDACITNSMYPAPDQPLLGWSNGTVAVDIKCGTAPGVPPFGPDNLFVIPNSTITSASPTLPGALTMPCNEMAPARDKSGSFSSVYLLASIIPGFTGQLSTCTPASSNTAPYVAEYTATASGVFGSNGCAAGSAGCSPVSVSPQFGQPAFYSPPSNATQLGCSSLSCQMNVGDARITGAQVRTVLLDSGIQSPVLATGFFTGINMPGSSDEAQNIWFTQNPATGAWLDGLSLAGPGLWVAYPTIAIDNDQDFYLGSTWFQAGLYPYTVWDYYKDLSTLSFLGQNNLEFSSGTYTGLGGNGPQQWGDYNTMVYDSNAKGPSGRGSFWQVGEISNGGADESTTWEDLTDAFPLMVGTYWAEAECANGAGSPCTLTLPAPSNTQFGDVFIAPIMVGQNLATSALSLPPGWTKLPFTNHNGDFRIVSSYSGFQETGWLLAYVYGSAAGDSGKYNFTFTPSTTGTEILGRILAYRGAGQNFSNYTAWGYPFSGVFSTITLSAPSPAPPAKTELLNIFCSDYGNETTEAELATYSAPTGSPALTVRTNSTTGAFFGADVDVPAPGGSFGPYTTKVTDPSTGAPAASRVMGWQVAIPEQ